MEVKINREIRNYTEAVFFGLSLRQLIASCLSVGAAAALWFLLRAHLPDETLSWVCILGAAPFAAAGFVRYHGMTCEELLITVLRSTLLTPRCLPAVEKNLYAELLGVSGRKRRTPRKTAEVPLPDTTRKGGNR